MAEPIPFSIPTISLRGVPSSPTRRQETITSLRNAALNSGFFQLVDLDDMIQSPSAALISSMFKQLESFFSLPSEIKDRVVKKSHLVAMKAGNSMI
jgi:isopenicillin N synthase-like dioxygenase